jgi:MscS family membrane protein
MKNFPMVFRSLMVLLLVVLVWSVWRSAAETNLTDEAAGVVAMASNPGNTNVVAAANKPPLVKEFASPDWIISLAQHWPFLRYHFWGNELWKYIFSLAYIFLAFYVSKFLDYLTRVWLKKWAEKTESKLDDLLLELLNGPVKIISFVIFLRVGLDVFDWPAEVQNFLSKGFTIIVAITITYAVMKLVDLLMGYWHLRTSADADPQFREQIFPIIRKTIKAFVLVVATLVTLSNIGVNITAAIASLSIGGLAVGLAAQDTLANLFGAVAILLDKPFRIGDQIMVDSVTGAVEIIGLRSTKLRNLDGHLVTIPNKTMANATLTNVTSRPNIKTVMNIGITYDTPTEKVKRALVVLEEIYKAHPKTKDLLISFNKFTDSTLNLQVVHWWNSTDMKEYLKGMQEINLAIKERFDAEGIHFAFPSQTVYLKQDANRSLAPK